MISKHPRLITTTLSNIFTMRLVGNKTHGDLAEIAIAEFVNRYMYDFKSVHVGKDLYRAKSHEEDITIINEVTHEEFPVSLKAYGDGPLQLSTDKHSLMYPRLFRENRDIEGEEKINAVFTDPAFVAFTDINVLPLIYDEKKKRCNILVLITRQHVPRRQKSFMRRTEKDECTRYSDFTIKAAITSAKSGMEMPRRTLCNAAFGRIRKMR